MNENEVIVIEGADVDGTTIVMVTGATMSGTTLEVED